MVSQIDEKYNTRIRKEDQGNRKFLIGQFEESDAFKYYVLNIWVFLIPKFLTLETFFSYI